jgi:glycosyltransferase involved in cell wall biosynthesis
VVDTFPAISETFVAAEIRALQALGAQVDVVAHAPAAVPDPDVDIPATFLATQRSRPPIRALPDLAAQRRWRREEQPLTLRELAPLIRMRPTHLHAHFGAGAALSALRVARITGATFSVTFHGYDIFQRPMNLAEKVREAAFVTSGSDYTVNALRELQPQAADKIHRIVMGVDTDVWTRASPHSEPGLVVAVGRLVEKKGFVHLARAAELLPDGMRVVIAGDGPLRAELAGGKVELLGALPSRAVRELVERAAVVAVPSVIASSGDRDSMPVIAKEALALEVPVVASDVCGLPEVVKPPWGVLVPPADPKALAQGILDAVGLDATAGRAYVQEHCSVATETRKLLDLISALGS